jgi:hypothetical protein
VRRLNIRELQQLIVDVRDLLHTLTISHSSASTHLFSNATEHAFDLIHLANLQHLLLCLQSQLLRRLVHLCIELLQEHIAECQKTRRRSREDYWFEFPEGRPPLSTTWPWTIKPSLAVLWGVCWMFFGPIDWDKEGNLIIAGENIQVSRQELDQLFPDPVFMNNNAQQHTPQRRIASHNNPHQMLSGDAVIYQQHQQAGAYPHHTVTPAAQPRLLPRNGSYFPPDSATMAATAQPHQHTRPRPLDTQPRQPSSRGYNAYSESRRSPFCLLHREADTEAAAQNQAPASFPGLAQSGTNTADYSAPPAAAHPVPVADGPWLPQDTNFHNPYLEQDFLVWQGQQVHTPQGRRQYTQPAHSRGNANLAVQTESLPPRPRSTSQVTPTIRVTTEHPYTPDSQAQPQDSHPTSATSLHAPYNYGPTTYIGHNALYADANFHDMAEIQMQQLPQMGANNGIASPISDNNPALSRPISPTNAPMVDPNIRKRSFSEMSQQQPPPPMQMMPADHQSPQPSPYETSPGGMEDAGHKVQRMIKRGDPPQAHDGKYYCNFAPECADQYFDRKCEWR